MNADEIEKVVFEIAAKVAKREPQELRLETKIAEDLGLKSMSRIELAALLEDRLGVLIDNFEIRTPKTIAALIDLVKAKMG